MGTTTPEYPCAYCGESATTKDHVVPSALYPPSKVSSRVQRITVDACDRCNGGWSNDEVHFRNMLVLSGYPNPVALELWKGGVLRSFEQPDGRKRAHDLFVQMMPIRGPVADHTHMIFPARDERVMRIVRKVVRGLCHHHQLLSPVLDGEVWADHHRYEVPPALLADMTAGHVEEDTFDYKYMVIDDSELHSGWLLRFFQRVGFFCLVFPSIEARNRIEMGPRQP